MVCFVGLARLRSMVYLDQLARFPVAVDFVSVARFLGVVVSFAMARLDSLGILCQMARLRSMVISGMLARFYQVVVSLVMARFVPMVVLHAVARLSTLGIFLSLAR